MGIEINSGLFTGCTCPDCSPHLYTEKYVPQPILDEEYKPQPFTDFIAPNKAPNMSKDAFNLVRISRGEEGKTAYFHYPDFKDAPEYITWLWADGVVSTHINQSASPSTNTTTKEWWDSHVVNAPWPSTELIIDLYEDVFTPRNTDTHRYQIKSSGPILTKTVATKLLKDPLFVSELASMAGDYAKATAFINFKAKQPAKPKPSPAKTIPKPKPSPAKTIPKPKPSPYKKKPKPKTEDPFGEDDFSDKEPDNPFDITFVDEIKAFPAKVSITALDANGNPTGNPISYNATLNSGNNSYVLNDLDTINTLNFKSQMAFYGLLKPPMKPTNPF